MKFKHPIDPEQDLVPIGEWIGHNQIKTTRETARINYVAGWWWFNAVEHDSIIFKLSHFLTTVFTVQKEASYSAEYFYHLKLTLYYALGNFKTFAVKMTRDNAMLAYLDNTTNTKLAINENYAREFLELFTLGKVDFNGKKTYAEEDIPIAAKVLTGFKRATPNNGYDYDNTTKLPRGPLSFTDHDTYDKTFSAFFGGKTITGAKQAVDMQAELEQFVDMIFKQEAVARNFCRKLYRYFVRSEITADTENNIITSLTKVFIDNKFAIAPTVRFLLTSKHFYDLDDTNANDEIIGGLIKSPLQLISEVYSYLGCKVITNPLNFNANNDFRWKSFWNIFMDAGYFNNSNMVLFSPETVAGHQAYYQNPDYDKNWITATSLIGRYKGAKSLISGENQFKSTQDITYLTRTEIDFITFLKNSVSKPEDSLTVCKELCIAFFGQEPSATRIAYFNSNFLSNPNSTSITKYQWENNWIKIKENTATIIVKQDAVKRLKKLLELVLISPESQLF